MSDLNSDHGDISPDDIILEEDEFDYDGDYDWDGCNCPSCTGEDFGDCDDYDEPEPELDE